MKQVSVIIPIYNVEECLPQCLDSVINQTYRNLEIICVNDCSPDNSAEILQQYALKDARIKIINREKNGGLSAARNTGFDNASGEYIYFIDSDDWIDEDYLEKMVNAIEKANTDIVLNTNIIRAEENTAIPFEWKRYSKQLPEGEYLSTETAINCSQVMIWAHLYKKSFLDEYNLRFPEGYIQEDEYFQHISKIRCDKIFCFSGSAYFYRQRPESIMGARKSKVIPVAGIFDLLIDFYSKNSSFLLLHAIKFSLINAFAQIEKEDEFKIAKKSVYKFFCSKLCFNFTDFEYFLLMLINGSSSVEEFKQKIGKNVRIVYMRKALTSKPKVSVIIPCYNVEPYLRKCLNSVCNQTLRDIEIICVNDCSPDNSLEILKEYAQNDNRIKIIDFKQNQGVAIARNTAMAKAKGEYIGFVDPDDWIDIDFYEKLYNKAKECNSDLVIGNIRTVLNGKEINHNVNFDIFSKERVFYGLFPLGLYKRDLLQKYDIKFTEGCIIGEDRLLPIMSCYYAQHFEIVNNVFYCCLKRENSATKNISERKINDFIYSSKLVLEFVNSRYFNDNQYNAIFRQFWDGTINLFVFSNVNSFKNLCEFCEYLFSVAQNKNLFSQIDMEILEAIRTKDAAKLIKFAKIKNQKALFQGLRKQHITNL